MKRDISKSLSGRPELPSTHRRAGFFSPLFEDYFEPARWFDDFFNRDLIGSGDQSRSLAPAIDIDETSGEYLITADLPGIKKEDINIECTGGQLTISAERRYETTEGRKQERRERFYGTFQRSFTLPSGVDAENIQASYDGGVLTVTVPKVEQAKARKIEIGERTVSRGSQVEPPAEKH